MTAAHESVRAHCSVSEYCATSTPKTSSSRSSNLDDTVGFAWPNKPYQSHPLGRRQASPSSLKVGVGCRASFRIRLSAKSPDSTLAADIHRSDRTQPKSFDDFASKFCRDNWGHGRPAKGPIRKGCQNG